MLAFWLLVVHVLGLRGQFVGELGTPPWRIALAVTLPVAAFLVAVGLSAAFRGFVLAANVALLTAVQSWRFAGFGFLALYAYGVLPAQFAYPAGLGDMAIGITAPWMALALMRRPAVVAEPLFVAWNLLGILDLIVAVGTAAVITTLGTGDAGVATVLPMARMPLVLIPAYLVPLFIMLHAAALLQARRPAKG